MGRELFIQDWELLVRSDLAPHLIPFGQHQWVHRPADVGMVPDGARQALARAVGRHGLEDLLIVPALVRPSGSRWRRRCRYAPLCVLGIGERGLGLWVQAPPPPEVWVTLPFGSIAVIERQDDGPWRKLIVVGPGRNLSVQYNASGDVPAGTWVRRLRRRCAGRPGPLPAGLRKRRRPRLRDVRPLLADQGDDAVIAGPRPAPWRRPCLLAVTSQEVIVAWSRPWRAGSRTVYIERNAVAGAMVRSRSLLLRTSGDSVRVQLPSRAVAAAAARCLGRPPVIDTGRGWPEAARSPRAQ